MKVIGVIPARWGSTRFPGKSLTPILGKPLIQRVLERASQARSLAAVMVATDDDRIFRAVERFGFKAVMTGSHHPSGTDRIAEAVKQEACDVVINIQGDEPLIDPGLIDRLAGEMGQNEKWDMGTAASPIMSEEDLKNPSVVKVVFGQDRAALYFSRLPIPFVRDAGTATGGLHWRHIGLYGYRRSFLERLVQTPVCALEEAEKLEQLRALYLGGRIVVLMANEAGIGVDTPADVAKVEGILRKMSQTRI